MKRLLVVLIAVALVVLMTACGKTNDTEPNTSNNNSTTSSENTSAPQADKELVYNSTEAFDYLEVENGVEIIEFKNYDNIKYSKIIIPSQINNMDVVGIGSLEEVDYIVFGDFSSPCEVVIPQSVSYIGGRAFQGAKGLVKLSGGENCKTIGNHAFMNCVDLTEITFLDGVTNLAENAFTGCTAWEANH